MGEYLYLVRTKNRMFTIDGAPALVHPAEYYSKPSYRDRQRNHETALQARLERVWATYDPAQYIAFGGLEDGAPVYEWKRDSFWLSDGATERLNLVGYLRGKGRSLRFEQWYALEAQVASWQELREKLEGMLSGTYSYRRLDNNDPMMELRLVFGTEEDFVRAKLALS